MKNSRKGPVANRIAEIRKQNHLSTEQVSILIGERSTERLEKYESGAKTPNLKTALKLAHIFNLPVRIMLDGYFDACRTEIKNEQLRFVSRSWGKKQIEIKPPAVDFCSFEARLALDLPSERDISKSRRHAAELIRTAAEKLGHI